MVNGRTLSGRVDDSVLRLRPVASYSYVSTVRSRRSTAPATIGIRRSDPSYSYHWTSRCPPGLGKLSGALSPRETPRPPEPINAAVGRHYWTAVDRSSSASGSGVYWLRSGVRSGADSGQMLAVEIEKRCLT